MYYLINMLGVKLCVCVLHVPDTYIHAMFHSLHSHIARLAPGYTIVYYGTRLLWPKNSKYFRVGTIASVHLRVLLSEQNQELAVGLPT